MQEIKHFKNKEEAIKYGREANFGKYDFEKIVIEEYENTDYGDVEIRHNQTVILCGTDMLYENKFYPFAYSLLDKFGFDVDDACGLRNKFMVNFEEFCNIRFLDVYDEY